MQEVKEKVIDLEKTLNDFILHTNLGFAKVQNALIEQRWALDKLKEEMVAYREHSAQEMKEFKEEMVGSRRELNKMWGDLANRLGTVAEDIVAPNLPVIARRYFGCVGEPLTLYVRSFRFKRKDRSQQREFDVIAEYEEIVLFNETKTTSRQSYIDDFLAFLPQLPDYWPEFTGKKIIPIYAALYIPENQVAYATQRGLYVLALRGETMDLLNYHAVKPVEEPLSD
ncbi:MAG TPA: hypothetical protein VLH40_04945 [Atribacteraceae bacterium]|nr:hypothetical protein [Atribacteraceae bacterium]